MTAEYFSKLCGTTTVRTLSTTLANAVAGLTSQSTTTTTTTSYGSAARSLILPDELMTMPPGRQILLVENMSPISAERVIWYEDAHLKTLGTDLYKPSGQPTKSTAATNASEDNGTPAAPPLGRRQPPPGWRSG